MINAWKHGCRLGPEIGSRKSKRAIFYLLTLLALGTRIFAGVQIQPEVPRWGQDLVVRITPESSVDTLYPGDQVLVGLRTYHQGLYRRVATERATWDGQAFVCRLTLPGNCEKALVYVTTPEKWTRYKKQVLPRTETGEVPPGAKVLPWPKTPEGLPAWKQDIEAELAENPQLWWIYPEIWQRKMRTLGDATVGKIRSQLASLETQVKDPSLLRTLAYGYWSVGQPDRAFERLTELIARFPESAYSVKALNEAGYQIFSKNLDHLTPRMDALTAKVVNEAPQNPQLRQETNAILWVVYTPGMAVGGVRNLCEGWIEEDPADPYPYFLLANALLKEKTSYEEAERLIDRSLELFYQPRSADAGIKHLRGLAFRVRSQLRLGRGAVSEALADIKMAQEYALAQSAEDFEVEAEIWRGIGYLDKAEEILLEAYRKGSLKAEELFKKNYTARTGQTDGFQEYFMSRLTGEASDPDSARKPDLEPAPEIEGTTLDGKELTSESLKGQLLVANFWFTTCGPCIGEIPRLNQLARKFAGQVRFLAFATDSAEQVRDFLKDREFNYEIVPSSRPLARAFGVNGYPRHYIIDREGNLIWKARGADPENVEKLEAMLERLLSGRI